jgi:hypothetical protein
MREKTAKATHEYAPFIKQSIGFVYDEMLHGRQIHPALFDQSDKSLQQVVGKHPTKYNCYMLKTLAKDCLRRCDEDVVT